MPGVILSYRKDDTKSTALRLGDALIRALGEGQVTVGVESLIKPGDDFVEAITAGVKQAEALLVLVGAAWTAGDWLTDTDDYDRLALGAALREGKRIVVVTADDASLPDESALPADLRPLAGLTPMPLKSDTFRDDAAKIIAGLPKPPSPPQAAPQSASQPAPAPRPRVDDFQPPSFYGKQKPRLLSDRESSYAPYAPDPMTIGAILTVAVINLLAWSFLYHFEILSVPMDMFGDITREIWLVLLPTGLLSGLVLALSVSLRFEYISGMAVALTVLAIGAGAAVFFEGFAHIDYSFDMTSGFAFDMGNIWLWTAAASAIGAIGTAFAFSDASPASDYGNLQLATERAVIVAGVMFVLPFAIYFFYDSIVPESLLSDIPGELSIAILFVPYGVISGLVLYWQLKLQERANYHVKLAEYERQEQRKQRSL